MKLLIVILLYNLCNLKFRRSMCILLNSGQFSSITGFLTKRVATWVLNVSLTLQRRGCATKYRVNTTTTLPGLNSHLIPHCHSFISLFEPANLERKYTLGQNIIYSSLYPNSHQFLRSCDCLALCTPKILVTRELNSRVDEFLT